MSLFAQYEEGQESPPLEDLMSTLKSTIGTFSHVYVVLDALDEGPERHRLLTLLGEIHKWDIDTLHLLATSRKEPDIEDGLRLLVSNEISMEDNPVDDDIRVHVTRTIDHDIVFHKFSIDERDQIFTTLTEGAHGM
jgi:hypothetical protein